ncbi:helix-turn-helix domain-containing protein [Nocardia australiensis]|uniref:helix-turn-helix domain-containing protein n=1 Tax=Nocardia australiensis TaxID=2887191 RepID=UPI001D13D8BC|nr:helix-turn-helix domain-containing protein [Nocardia australiensis]
MRQRDTELGWVPAVLQHAHHVAAVPPAFGHWSIGTIACGLGFGSAGTFSTAFRQRFGVTPRAIRRS